MIAIAVLIAQYAGTLDLSDTTKVDARVTQICQPDQVTLMPGSPRCIGPSPPGPAPKVPSQVLIAGDLSTALTALLTVRDRHWDYGLSYAPTATAPDVEVGLYPELFQSGIASVGWHDRFTHVLVSETASYGLLNPALLYQLPVAPSLTTGLAQPTAPGQSGAPSQPTTLQVAACSAANPKTSQSNGCTIDFGSSSTNAYVSSRLTRRATASLSGGYKFGGGLTDAARAFLPLQYGPFAGASVSYASSRTDALTTLASGQYTYTSGPCGLLAPGTGPGGIEVQDASGYCKFVAPIAQLEEVLLHQLSATGTLSVGVGAGVLEGQQILSPTRVRNVAEIQPVASIVVTDRLDADGVSTLALSAQLAPFVDVRTGLSDDRIQLSASLIDQFEPTALATLTASWLQSAPFFVNDPYPLTAVAGGAELKVHVIRQLLDVGFGEQALWQTQSGYGTLFSFIGYVNATARAPTLVF